jgi:sulfite reductase (NADPH) flavoprotein alpha-component
MSIPVLPESAPFSTDQRAWINGFFAGVLSVEAPPSTAAVRPGRAKDEQASQSTAASPQPEDFPWHDPTLSLDERMQLAEGRPLEQRLMGAMAQLDCGTCGYICRSYAEAIARGDERDLARCTPGGVETTKKLKELMSRAPAN